MALKMNVREVDGVGVVALEGRVVLGEESNALREQVKSMLAAGQKKIVLNMDHVTYIDSAGLGTLVAAHHSARTQGASNHNFPVFAATDSNHAGADAGFDGHRSGNGQRPCKIRLRRINCRAHLMSRIRQKGREGSSKPANGRDSRTNGEGSPPSRPGTDPVWDLGIWLRWF